MKYQSTKFEDYIQNCKKFNLHKEIIPLLTDVNNDIKNTNNLILYGPSGIGKYTQALNYIKNFSPTALRFERKMNFNFDNKSDFIFKISDIHFEIDMSLLGCKAKIVFNDLYYHILDDVALIGYFGKEVIKGNKDVGYEHNIFDDNLIDGVGTAIGTGIDISITPKSNLYLRYKNVNYLDKNHENYFYNGYELSAEFKVIF